MFDVRRSIKRFRDDPAWTFQDNAPGFLAQFDRGGYPFSLGPKGNGIHNLARGNLPNQRPVSLFHLNAWVRTGGATSGQHADVYSVTVLELDLCLPATAFTAGRLAHCTKNWTLPALPASAGTAIVLPPRGPDDRMHRCTTDPAYTEAVDTPHLRSLMRTPVFGWRTDGSRLIGWSRGRQPMDHILTLAQRLDTIADLISDQ